MAPPEPHRTDPQLSDQDMRLAWLMGSLDAGHDLLAAIVQGLEHDPPDLSINPSAWENTMTALEWAILEGLAHESLCLTTTAEDLGRVRRGHALGSAALAGESVSPDLLPLARQCRDVLRPMLRSASDAGTPDVVEACVQGSFCVYALLLGLERGAADLPIERSAWETTMEALIWALSEIREGKDPLSAIRVEEDDVGQVRRLHVLGSAALASGERSPDLLPLAEHYLALWAGPDWRRSYGKVLGVEYAYPPRSPD